MTFEAYDVVVVPFPFTNRDTVKRRPALVVSNGAFNRVHRVAVLSMITSAANAGWPSDVRLSDLAAAGLRVASVVRLKLFTLEQSLILKPLGRLAVADRKAIGAALQEALG